MEHGTAAGYQRHIRAKEHVCDPCRQAARIQWKRERIRRKAGIQTATYNKPKLTEWRENNHELEPAIVAVWNDRATPAQQQAVDAWYKRAWGLTPRS